MAVEINKRNSGRIQIIQETTKKIDNTLEKILTFEDLNQNPTIASPDPQMPHLEDTIQDNTSEESHNYTDVGASAP